LSRVRSSLVSHNTLATSGTPGVTKLAKETEMKLRTVLMGLIASAALAGVVSCGGGSDSPAPTYTVGGTLAGTGGVVMKLNGAGDITVAGPGTFTFAGGITSGTAYTVTATAPQNCTVANGTGTMGSANVTNVVVTCTTVVRSAALSGANENPANASTATGRGALVVNPTTKEVTGGISFTGLTPTAGGHHIHQAPIGSPTLNGPVIIALTLATGGGVATVPAGTVLTDAQYAAYLAGELYFNVHTTANPGGEIRGPITGTTGVTAGLATLNGAQENATNTSTATGRGTIVFDSTTREILIGYVTHDVSAATVAHIHTGAVGVSGPANVVTLTQGTGIYTAPQGAILSAQSVADLSAGNTYFNVHSTNNSCPPAATCAAGEIRGQIAVQ
jgi:CHRD domain